MTLAQWTPTANYLSEQIAGAVFHIKPLELFETRYAAAAKSIDFLLTNPGNYVEIEELHGLRPIATLKNLRQGNPYTTFGAVIFTRADRDDINVLADLKGKTFMGVKQSGFGGFQMAWREFVRNGIDPFHDFATLQFSGFPQDAVAYAVRDGLIDAGTFRTDTLERMAKAGKIKLEDFKIINAKKEAAFPFALSTPLYPEWSIAALSHIDSKTAKAVTEALLALSAESVAAKSAASAGWTEPVAYSEVRALLTELEIEPFKKRPNITFAAVLEKYWFTALISAVALIVLVSFTAYISRMNGTLRRAKSAMEVEVRERQSAENELRRHRDELEEIVRMKTEDLQRAHNIALEASSAKSRFLANTSHELRTPLNAIIGYSEMVLEESDGIVPESVSKDIEKIRLSGKHLLELINGILDLSKIEAGKMELCLTEARIVDVIESVIEIVTPLAQSKRNTLEVSPISREATMLTDVTKLRQVLTNIVSNACKFAPDGRVSIAVQEIEERSQTWYIFTVADSGIGMTQSQCEKLFDPFTQANHQIQEKYGGTGLGLAISRGYCNLMGGTIEVRSEVGTGSCFTVTLPRNP